jgi:hypothetical protein
MGIGFLDELVDMLEDRQDPVGARLYRHPSYPVVNQVLDQIALQIANTIQRKGFRALPIPASKRANDELIAGVFSQKLAAHLAGLGWIGKSCLLVTPDHGPRVRWITVLTDAPLAPTGMPWSPGAGSARNAWTSVRSTHSPAARSLKVSPGKPGSMLLFATGILKNSRRATVLRSAACACMSARSGKKDHTVQQENYGNDFLKNRG